jgi:transcriptional regulator with XRE-family HTH domain
MSLADTLKQLRERAGMSQSALAERAGLSLRSIQNWEQGHRLPKAGAVLSLARALGADVEDLLTELADQPQAEVPPRPRGKGKKGGGK